MSSLLLAALLAQGAPAPTPSALDRAFAEYWKASSPKKAEKAAEAIVASGAGFDEVYARLAAGRDYSADVDKGVQSWPSFVGGGPAADTTLLIPIDYDPAVRYPVRVFLHGGVGRARPDVDAAAPDARRRRRLQSAAPAIWAYPAGFDEAQWWFHNQVEAIDELLDRLKRRYNVDENRVSLLGVSDGGTGAYFFGMRAATPFAALFPFNGHLGVLANPAMGADGELFASNLVDTPLYVVNGGRDPLYPPFEVEPYLLMLERAGVRITYRPKPQAGHDTSWWPEESPAVDAFAAQHPRDPLPDRLSWSTERGKRYARFRWLVIESLGAGHSESPLEDPNTIERTPPRDFGLRIDSSRGGEPRQVVEVIEGSNAQAMGLRKGDEIQAIDGAAIHTLDDILRAFGGRPESRPVVFEVLRHGGTQRMEGTVPPLPPSVREPAFPRRHDFGRVDLERQGNRIEARTRGVAAFTLLLSPERIDFAQPLVVVVNGRTVFEGRVEKDVATLVRWAARDDDRTMLFGAELRIAVP